MSKNISIAIVGSFRKDPVLLKELFEHLSSKYTVLSPTSINWDNPGEEFVKVSSDADKTVREIEERHLDAIREADFIVLFAPEGYVGVSGALEVGFAHALGIPVISSQEVNNQTIAAMISGTLEGELVSIDYGRGLKMLQKQYSKIAKSNGWDKESARDTMLLLTEEVGELARAVRKHEGLKRDGEFDVRLSEEIADVEIYLAHLSNIVGVDLGDAVTDKILKNYKKKN